MSLPTGARLGAFEVIADLGAGGMGEVYHARDTRLERTAAIAAFDRRGQRAVDFSESLNSSIRIMPTHGF
jgi:serine/threonine protein kinase